MEKKTYTPEELVHIRDTAESFSLRYPTIKRRNLSKEFGSYVIIEALEGRYKKFSWMVTDFLRIEYGRLLLNNGKQSQKTQARLSRISIDGELSKKDKATIIRRTSPSGSNILEALPPDLKSQEHAMLLLFFKWGLSQKEIGELFRFSESRASQLISSALAKVKASLKESRGTKRKTE